MNEREFLIKLQERAKEQEKLIHGVAFPGFFMKVCLSLGNHPWRVLIPMAFLISLILRGIIGQGYTDFILLVFRKL